MIDERQENLPRNYFPLSLASGIRAAMYRNPEKIALQDALNSRNFRQLVERFDRITQGFISDLDLTVQDHAAILADNAIEYVEIVAGASQAGVALATINPRLANDELVRVCDDSNACVLFVDANNAERARDCEFASVERIIEFGQELEAWIAAAKPIQNPPLVPEEQVFTIPYTSGTTGEPKGVMVSHRSRMLSLYAMAAEYGCYSPDDRFLAIAPLCHGAGMAFALAAIYFGGYTQLMHQFEAEMVVNSLKQDHISGVFMVPTHFHKIFELEESVLALHRDTELRSIISNAAPLPQASKEKIVEYFGEGLLHETYGSTEAGIVTNLRPEDQLRKQKCVGLPFTSTLVKILDENHEECAANEDGELFSYSPFLFNGYWNKAEETEAAYRDGWVTVGDVARKDEEGYIYITDRKKEMIISGGINIYPREVENILIEYPGIVEAGVIGVADDQWGERLKAFIVVAADADFDQDKVVSHCKKKLASFKVPDEYQLIDKLPRNSSGKLVKKDLAKIDA